MYITRVCYNYKINSNITIFLKINIVYVTCNYIYKADSTKLNTILMK